MSRLKRSIIMIQLIVQGGGYKKVSFLKKKHYFKTQGEHYYFQPWNFGTEPYLISFGNNVHVVSGVTFVNHDITALMFRYMEENQAIQERKGEICIGNNVFIGSNSTILYDVVIGDNVIIGAGSLVNKSIPSGSVAAGVPCKVVGRFDDYKERITNGIYNFKSEKR